MIFVILVNPLKLYIAEPTSYVHSDTKSLFCYPAQGINIDPGVECSLTSLKLYHPP